MIRRLIVALLLVLAALPLLHWTDRLHLVALAGALAVLAVIALAIGVLRRRATGDDDAADWSEEETSANLLRDGAGGLLIGCVGLAIAGLLYSYALPPFYPLLVGDCPQLLPKLAIYEETKAWQQAIAVIDDRLARPIDKSCRAQLAQKKAQYLIAWGKTLPANEAAAKFQEAERWSQQNGLDKEQQIAQLLRAQLQKPTTIMVTPTPQPSLTPRSLAAGSRVEITGIDLAYFPPTAFVYLRVLDPSGRPVTDLQASDLRVTDDSRLVQEPSLAYFQAAPSPISAALVIDYSGSMAGAPLSAARAGARAFLDQLGANDQVEIIGFGDKVQLLQSWTADKSAAVSALDQLQAQGWTALWDGLWLAAGDLSSRSGRKVVLLLTDGADNRSQHTSEQVIAQARRAGLSLFVIGLQSPEYNGAAMQSLVQAVGGRYTETSDPAQIEAYYKQIAGDIRNEYRLALTLPRSPTNGGSHRLRIEVGGPQPLVAEQGYTDPGQ